LIDPHDRIALRWLLGYGSHRRLREHCELSGVEPWNALVQLSSGEFRIPHTNVLVTRFREIHNELEHLRTVEEFSEFVPSWLQEQLEKDDPFRKLVLDLALEVDAPGDLLAALLEAVSLPEVPPDVTEVRIMSLHKSQGLSSPVVIIAGCVEGLLPTAPDQNLSPAENLSALEEQRRLFFVGLTRVKANPDIGRPGVLRVTSSRTMSLADAKQSGIRPARVAYANVHLHASRFIQELGPAAPPPSAVNNLRRPRKG
jgi:superfamily I DNA/RNA helicase